ncbi:MAG: DUF3486 family protein [Gammaproteobacteria bacterium]|nr:MAG: DUF3486 family protein [Gammaproteobacteria bacterium]
MSRPSTIDLLPTEVRDALHGWLRDPSITQAEAAKRANALLEELGIEARLSKSALNRYAIKMNEVGERLRQSRQVAEMWIAKLGAAPQGQVGNLVNEILRTLAFDLSITMQRGDIDPEEAPAVARMLKDMAVAMEKLERAASENVKRTEEIKRAEREAAAEKAARVASRGGMSRETVEAIRAEILGVPRG